MASSTPEITRRGTLIKIGDDLVSKNHCLFCLKFLNPAVIKEVSKNKKSITEFQPLIHYLTGTDPTYDRSLKECLGKGIPLMEKLPPMCVSCYDVFAELHGFHKELLKVQGQIQKQTGIVRVPVVLTLGPPEENPARQEFYKRLKADEEPIAATNAQNFVDKLHEKIISQKGKENEILFPSKTPPPPVKTTTPAKKASSTSVPKSFLPSIELERVVSFNSVQGKAFEKVHKEPVEEGLKPTRQLRPPEKRKSTKPSYPFEEANDDDIPTSPKQSPTKPESKSVSSSPQKPFTMELIQPKIEVEEDGDQIDEGESFPASMDVDDDFHDDNSIEGEGDTGDALDTDKSQPQAQTISSTPSKKVKKEEQKETPANTQQIPKLTVNIEADGISYKLLLTPSTKQVGTTKALSTAENEVAFTLRYLDEDLTSSEQIFPRRILIKKVKGSESEDELATKIIKALKTGLNAKKTSKYKKKHNAKQRLRYRSSKPDGARRIYNEEGVLSSQRCDLCDVTVTFEEIRQHLESHYVKDFIKECPNPDCQYTFSCSRKLLNHSRKSKVKCKELSRKERACEFCGMKFTTLEGQSYRRHLERHEESDLRSNKTLECPIPTCNAKFALWQSVDEHIYLHTEFKPRATEQSCSVCNETVKIENLPDHLKEAHSIQESDISPCNHCPFIFHSKVDFIEHLFSHRDNIKGVACDICTDGIKFNRREILREHYFNVHQIGKKLACEECFFEFYAEEALAAHKQQKHEKKEAEAMSSTRPKVSNNPVIKKICPQCSLECESLVTFKTHMLSFHGVENPFTCRHCNEAFPSYQKCRSHELEHEGRSDFICTVEGCCKVFKLKRTYITHMKFDHSGVGGVTCEVCGKLLRSERILRQHQRKVHSGVKEERRICETCGESFASRATLRKHKMIHTGERPYTCSICGQPFRHREVMLKHMKSHEEKGDAFKPSGPMQHIRKRVKRD